MTATASRLVIVDDHAVVRASLIELLTAIGFDVVAQAGTADEAIAEAARTRPDVVVLDVGIPGGEPADTIRAIQTGSPDTRVVVLTMFDHPRLIRDLIDAGANGFVLKASCSDELISAIRAIAGSGDAVVLSITRAAFNGLAHPPQEHGNVLTERELTVLRAAADMQQSNRDMAHTLRISEATVKRHLSNIYTKLGASSRSQAVQAVRDAGLLPNDVPRPIYFATPGGASRAGSSGSTSANNTVS